MNYSIDTMEGRISYAHWSHLTPEQCLSAAAMCEKKAAELLSPKAQYPNVNGKLGPICGPTAYQINQASIEEQEAHNWRDKARAVAMDCRAVVC